MFIYRSFLPRMRSASNKSCKKKNKTHNIYSVSFFCDNHAISEITWNNTVQPYKLQITVLRMCTVCWKTKVTHKLIAFPLQPWFKNAPQCYVIRALPVLFICALATAEISETHLLLPSSDRIKFPAFLLWSSSLCHCIVP